MTNFSFRYMAVVLKPNRRLKLRTARILTACLWLTAICISLFPILFWGKYQYTSKSTLCKPKDSDFMIFVAIVSFVIPVSTMVFCYVNVFLKVHRHKQMLRKTGIRRFNAEIKTTKIVFTVLAVFIAFWAPYYVIYSWSLNSNNKDIIPTGVFKFFQFLTAAHSCCNPIIYFTMVENFRKTSIKLLRSLCSRVFRASGETIATMD